MRECLRSVNQKFYPASLCHSIVATRNKVLKECIVRRIIGLIVSAVSIVGMTAIRRPLLSHLWMAGEY